jgi:hypothetical protein
MRNGLYAVEFGTGVDTGSGVLVYRDGEVRGGDAGYAYIGNIVRNGDALSGELEIFQHQPGHPSVFGNVGSFDLQVVGTATGDDKARFHGESPAFRNVGLKVLLQLIRAD